MLYPLNAICLGIFWQFTFFYFILITFRGIYKGGTFLKYDINFRHLEYFIKVARLGSINKAAQALYISQPYLGKIMHVLEENLGARLFNRSRSGVTLTPEGMEFLTHSEKIIDEMEQLWFQKKKEQIKISDPLAVSMTRFSHIMESFSEIVLRHRDQPSFSHRLYEGNSDEVIEDVVSGRVDVGVFHFDSRKRRELDALLESNIRFCCNRNRSTCTHWQSTAFSGILDNAMIIFTNFSPKGIRMQKKCARKSPISPAAPP